MTTAPNSVQTDVLERLRANADYMRKHDDGILRLEAECLDGAHDLIEAQAKEIERLRSAGEALIADVRRRYPSEELRCEYMRALANALQREG